MGAYIRKPKTEVTSDPNVAMYVWVSGTALLDSCGSRLLSGTQNGLIYVRDDRLFYEASIVKGVWKKRIKRSWNLAQVTHMTVVRNQSIRVRRQAHSVSMRPGLKISLKTYFGERQSLAASMPEAEQFSTQLAQYINAVPRLLMR